MNQTNRFLNRLILLLVGLVLLGVGAGVVILYVWPAATDWWSTTSTAAMSWLHDANERTLIATSTLSRLVVGFLAAILLLIIMLIIVLARLGGGHTTALIRTNGQHNVAGRVIIDTAFASEALGQILDQRPEILSSHVSVGAYVEHGSCTSPSHPARTPHHASSSMESLTCSTTWPC